MPTITGPFGLWQFPASNAILGLSLQPQQKIPAEQVGVIIQPGVIKAEEAIRAQQEAGRIITRRPGIIGGLLIEQFNRRFTPLFEQITRTSPARVVEEVKEFPQQAPDQPLISPGVTIS